MRTVDRFSFIFGIANMVIGALALFSPTVRHPTPRTMKAITRVTGGRYPRRHSRGIFNRGSGQLLGGLGAVNPPHALVHSALGAAGIATKPLSRFARPYMWINAILFLGMALVGWATVGLRPGIHKVMGMALDARGNIIHTLWGAGALLLALKPELGQSLIDREINQTIAEVSAD